MNSNKTVQETFNGEEITVETVVMNKNEDLKIKLDTVEEYTLSSEDESPAKKNSKKTVSKSKVGKPRVSKSNAGKIVNEFKPLYTSFVEKNFDKVFEHLKTSKFIFPDFLELINETQKMISNKKFAIEEVKNLMSSIETYYKLTVNVLSFFYQNSKYNHEISYINSVLKGSIFKNKQLYNKYTGHDMVDKKMSSLNFDFEFTDEETEIAIYNLDDISCPKLKLVLSEAENFFQTIHYTYILFLLISMYLYETDYVVSGDEKSQISILQKRISVLSTDTNKNTKEIIHVIKKKTVAAPKKKSEVNKEDEEAVKNINLKQGTKKTSKKSQKEEIEIEVVNNKDEESEEEDSGEVIPEQ